MYGCTSAICGTNSQQKETIMVRMTDGNKFTRRLTDMGCNTLGTCMTGFFPGRAR